jgi:hypothetical protein
MNKIALIKQVLSRFKRSDIVHNSPLNFLTI